MIKKVTLMVLVGALVLSGLTGCGSKNSAVSTNAPMKAIEMAAGQMNSGFSNSVSDKSTQAVSPPSESPQKPVNSHKIIQTGTISMESLKFDESVSKTVEYVASIGGYAESSNIQGQGIDHGNTVTKRTADYVFRVPSDKYLDFFSKMKGYGVVTTEQSQGQDITDQYFDTDARLVSLKIQEERELVLLQKAVKLSDILELEKELNSVRYQIESYTGTLRKWDSLVSYSTIKVNIREVDESKIVVPTKAEGLWPRMVYGFTDSTKQLVATSQNLVVSIVAMLPFLLVLGVIVVVGIFIRKKFKAWQAK